MQKKTLMLSIAVLGVLLYTASFNVFGAINKYNVPLVQSDSDVYISVEFSLLTSESDSYKIALNFNDSYIETEKTGSFDLVKSLFLKEDGSQEKFEKFRKTFNQSIFYKSIDSVKHNYVIAWGDFRFLSVDYTSNGRVRNLREDLYCPLDSMCKKSMRDFGQLFEIGYVKFIQKLQGGSGMQKGSHINSGTSKSLDKIKSFNVILPDSKSIENFNQNTFKITIGVKMLKSDVCIDCELSKNGVLKSENLFLKQLVKFANGLGNLDITNYESLLSYIIKFDENHKKTTAFPVVRWDNGIAKTIYADVGSYISRVKKWKGGVPLGYIKSNEGIYVFIRLDDGTTAKGFDLEVFFLKSVLPGQYSFCPAGNEGSLEQTLIRDPFILGSLKKLFLEQLL